MDPSTTLAVSGPLLVAALVAALAGAVSFASPCVVPLVPGYLAYLAGLVGADAPPATPAEAEADGERAGRFRVAGAAALFVAGFTVVFVAATASVFGAISMLALNQSLLQRIGGVVTIIMGLAFLGYIPVLQRDTRPHPRPLAGLLGAPVLGAVFGLGWTPCLGPTLAGVLSVAAAVGLVLFILAPSLPVAFVGVALWGAGASLGFPLGMSAAADDPTKAAASVSAAATIGYLAFLCGPPLLGWISHSIGILPTLWIIVGLIVMSGLASGAAKPIAGSKVGAGHAAH